MDRSIRELEREARTGNPDAIAAYMNAWDRAGRPADAFGADLFFIGLTIIKGLGGYETDPNWEDMRGNGKKSRQRKERQRKRKAKKAARVRREEAVQRKRFYNRENAKPRSYGTWMPSRCELCEPGLAWSYSATIKPCKVLYQKKWCGYACRDCFNLSREERARRIEEIKNSL